MYSNRGPMIRSSSVGAAWFAGPRHAAPMGLKTGLFGRWYYKHVAPTELAAQLPAGSASLAPAVVRCQLGILTVETASPAAFIAHLQHGNRCRAQD